MQTLDHVAVVATIHTKSAFEFFAYRAIEISISLLNSFKTVITFKNHLMIVLFRRNLRFHLECMALFALRDKILPLGIILVELVVSEF